MSYQPGPAQWGQPQQPPAPYSPPAPSPVPMPQQAPYGSPAPGQYPPAPGQYQPGVPVAPSAPVTPLSAQMSALFSPQGLGTLGLNLLVTLGIGIVSALLVVVQIAVTSDGWVSADFLSFAILVGASLGGGVTIGDTALFLTPISVHVLLWFAVFRLTKARAFKDGSIKETMPTAVRSVLEAAIIALIITLLTAFFVNEAELRANAVLTFFFCLITLSAAVFTGRQSAAGVQWMPAPLAQVWRELKAVTVLHISVFAAISMLIYIIAAVTLEIGGAALLVLPHLVLNIAFWVAGLAHFGGVEASASTVFLGFNGSLESETMMAWDLGGGWGVLLFMVALVLILVTSVHIGVRRDRTSGPDWGRIWQLPLGVFVTQLVLGVGLASFRLFGDRSDGSVGMTWWAPFTIAIAVALSSLAAEVTPRYFAANAPGLLYFFGGRRTAAAWLSSPMRMLAGPRAAGVPGAVLGSAPRTGTPLGAAPYGQAPHTGAPAQRPPYGYQAAQPGVAQPPPPVAPYGSQPGMPAAPSAPSPSAVPSVPSQQPSPYGQVPRGPVPPPRPLPERRTGRSLCQGSPSPKLVAFCRETRPLLRRDSLPSSPKLVAFRREN